MILHCYTCHKDIDIKETLNKASNGMMQIKGACPICGRWIKWIPYADSEIVKNLLNKEYAKKLS